MSAGQPEQNSTTICDYCGVTQRHDCIKGYAVSGPELMCENLLIQQRIVESLRSAGIIGDLPREE